MHSVAFFNHKGGVGKSTITFNVAIALGELGKRVVILDADAQANVSALGMSEEAYEEALNTSRTIWSALSPLVSGAGDLQPVPPTQIRDNVWVLPGDIRLSNFEGICPVGWTEALAGEARGFRVTSAVHRLVQSFRELVEADVVLVDLGPNVNALNRSALIAMDGFAVPLAPDLFSVIALPSVGQSISTWVRQWKVAISVKPATINFGLPKGHPRPLGYISQQFSTYRKKPTAAFRRWVDKMPGAYAEGVLEHLKNDVQLPDLDDASIGSLPNFGALIPIAQEANKALFELSGREAYGSQHTRAKETRDVFVDMAKVLLRRI